MWQNLILSGWFSLQVVSYAFYSVLMRAKKAVRTPVLLDVGLRLMEKWQGHVLRQSSYSSSGVWRLSGQGSMNGSLRAHRWFHHAYSRSVWFENNWCHLISGPYRLEPQRLFWSPPSYTARPFFVVSFGSRSWIIGDVVVQVPFIYPCTTKYSAHQLRKLEWSEWYLHGMINLRTLKDKQNVAIYSWCFNDICSVWTPRHAYGKLPAGYLGVVCSVYAGDGLDDHAHGDFLDVSNIY